MSGGIVKAGAAGLKSAMMFSYGLLTLFSYMAVAIRAGYFFSRPSEKERLELQLGMSSCAPRLLYHHAGILSYAISPPWLFFIGEKKIIKS